MNTARLVMDLVRGAKKLTVSVYDRERSLEEQVYPKSETRIIIRHDGSDPEDLENVFASSHICSSGNRRVSIPLNFDEIHGFDDLLNVFCAFTTYGRDAIFHIYNVDDGAMVQAYLVSHMRGTDPEVTEVAIAA